MRKLLVSLFLVTALSGLEAGTITHTDYNAGDVITSALQNTNENAIVNELNGNLDSANFEDGGIATADLADNAVTYGKLAAILQSTFTFVNQQQNYDRPFLQWISVTTVDISTNTDTANQTCVLFPDERRCVTEATGSTSVNRRFIITETAANSGTKNSGLIGAGEATDEWYALYAWKVSDNATDFVIAGTTTTPTQEDRARLDSMFGKNAYAYLGLIRNGDNASATGDIVKFRQRGSITTFSNSATSNFTRQLGMILTGAAGVVASTYTYTPSMTASNGLPPHISHVTWQVYSDGDTVASEATTSDNTIIYDHWLGVASMVQRKIFPNMDPVLGIATKGGSNIARELAVIGFVDGVLAQSIN